MQIPIAFGQGSLTVDVPDGNLAYVLEPRRGTPVGDLGEAVRGALTSPVDSIPLREMAHGSRSVVIIVDDITRPTPTKEMLPPILDELSEAGVPDEAITVMFATGLHRPHTPEEHEALLGADLLGRLRAVDHDASDHTSLHGLGATSRGTPVSVNRLVVEAELRVLTGLIKPHNQAGYTGGGKAILPGVCGMETIVSDHGYEAVGHPQSVIGVIEGNPIRADIEEAAAMVGPSFCVNVVPNGQGEIIGVVAGDLIAAHRAGADMLDAVAKVPAAGQVDVAIAGTGHPVDINLYQGLNGLTSCTALPTPLIKSGGTVITAVACPHGIGHHTFYDLLREGGSPEGVLHLLAQPGVFRLDQWAAQMLCYALRDVSVTVVTDNVAPGALQEMYLKHAPSLDQALAETLQRYRSDVRIGVLPHAPYTIPVVETSAS